MDEQAREQKPDSLLRRGWRNVREAGTRRLVITALLTVASLIIGYFSWALPITASAERALYDARFYVQASQAAAAPDPRVVMVVFDDQTLRRAQKRSPLDRGLLVQALRNLDALGPRAIGIDILFDQPQAEDAALIATLRAMKTPVAVGYANTATNAGEIEYEQQEFLDGFIAQLKGSKAHPGSVRLDDVYGVTRKFPSIEPGLPPVLGRAMLSAGGEEARTLPGYTGAIRYRLDKFDGEGVVPKLQIDTFLDDGLFADAEVRAMLREQIAGRYVLIGGDIVDYDRVATPLSETMDRKDPPGLQIHAEMIQQMLDGAALTPPSSIVLWTLTYLIVIMAILSGLLEWGGWRVYVLIALQFAAILGIPFAMQLAGVDTLNVPAFGWIVAWVLAFSAVTSAARAAGAAQRNFAQGALGKYLPREMAEEIIEHPELLSLHGEKKELFVLFSDLEGFTKMSHEMSPEMVAKVLNRYLDVLSKVVLDHGGVIDKFVGDAVVAFWGAPIQRPDDGMRAARAGYALWQAGEAFRDEVQAMLPDLPRIGKTRVGLHWGEAVVGNFGGQRRIQYTALGDSMNTASRLEAASKNLDSAIMASREFADRSGVDWWRAMGRVQLRGRAKPVELMEPAPGFPDADRDRLARAARFVDEDIAAAIALVADVAARYPDDSALQNLLKRTRHLEEGGSMCWGKRTAAAALVGLVMYAGAAQAGVVVKASGPSAGQFPVGKKLDDSSTVSLKAGDSITVLTANGTKVITGPGQFTVGVRGESKRSTFAVLTRQASGARVRTGAVRSGGGTAAPMNPSLWNMDVSQPGKFCLPGASRVTFWRSATAGERVYVLGSGESDYPIQIKFADGAAQASLTGEQLPLDSNRTYRLSSEASAPPRPVEFVVLDAVPATADGLASVLAEKGCTAQLTMLSDRLMTSAE